MDIVRLTIPYAFVRDRTRLSWRGVCFGLQNELLDPEAPRDMAVDQIAEFEEPSSTLLELASVKKGERTMELVEQLAVAETPSPEEKIRERWLYLVLAWIYEHRNECSDPLQRVEEVYADFDYPERIASFVRYMPMNGPDLGNREANERRLFERWAQYLDECSRADVR